jgi:hypothetical protein
MYNLFVDSNEELSWQAMSGSSKYTGRYSSQTLVRCIYSSSANSARPCFELRYSFLRVSAYCDWCCAAH